MTLNVWLVVKSVAKLYVWSYRSHDFPNLFTAPTAGYHPEVSRFCLGTVSVEYPISNKLNIQDLGNKA